MKPSRIVRRSLFALVLCLDIGAFGFAGLGVAHAEEKQESLRPEVGKPLLAAQALIKAGKFKEALVKIGATDVVANKTPYEKFIVERMRAAAAAGAGDNETAIRAFEAVLDTGRLPQSEQLKILEAIVGTYYRAKDYPRAVSAGERYFKQGGANPQIRTAVIQARYLNNDFPGAVREILADLQEDEKAGRTPSEERLQLLANCYLRLNDNSGYIAALERLLTHYPKKSYWLDLISRIQKKPGFSDRLALDVMRLQFATGNMLDANDYVYMAQLALQAGLPAEAKKVLDDGFAKNVLGAGDDGDRRKRLREFAAKQAAADLKALPDNERQALAGKDGNALLAVGQAYVTAGQTEHGLALMEQAVAEGGLKRPADARLHLGEAYLAAGNRDKAIQTLKGITGSDGVQDLARLWVIFARQ